MPEQLREDVNATAVLLIPVDAVMAVTHCSPTSGVDKSLARASVSVHTQCGLQGRKTVGKFNKSSGDYFGCNVGKRHAFYPLNLSNLRQSQEECPLAKVGWTCSQPQFHPVATFLDTVPLLLYKQIGASRFADPEFYPFD